MLPTKVAPLYLRRSSVHRLDNVRISKKLLIAYVLFLLPVAFLFYVIVDKSRQDSGFAAKEILGTRYIVALHEVQDALVRDGAAPAGEPLATKVSQAQQSFGADMATGEAADAAVKALKAVANDAGRAQARSALRDLMGKVAD